MRKMMQMSGRAGLILLIVLLFAAMVPQLCFGDAVVEKYYDTQYETDIWFQVEASDGGANLRSGPDTTFEVIASMMPNGTQLNLKYVYKNDKGSKWGYGEYKGNWGWVALSQGKEISAPSSSSTTSSAPKAVSTDKPETSVNYDVVVKAPDGGVNFRTGPGSDYEQIIPQMIPNGTQLHITGINKASNGKKWGATSYAGQTGWIFLEQCEEVKVTDTTEKKDTEVTETPTEEETTDATEVTDDSSSGMPMSTLLLLPALFLLLVIAVILTICLIRRKK